MAISRELLIRIRDFLVPHNFLGHWNGRRAISLQAGLDDELMNQVDFEGPTDEFLTLYLKALSNYGKLKDNRDALEAFLEAMKDKVGADDKVAIDEFIKSWRETKDKRRIAWPKPPIRPWLLVPVAVVIGLALIYVLFARRITPASVPIKEMENKTAYQDDINAFEYDSAARRQDDITFRYIVGTVESPIQTATKPFTWSLSTRPGLKMLGKAYRVTSQGSNDLQYTINADGSLDFTVPKCEKGDKLVAIIRVSWDEGQAFEDLKQVAHIKQILTSKAK